MANNPGNLEAQRLVQQLRAGGLSNSEIARRVGRDSSLISQIGNKGTKGASLVPALRQIGSGAKSVSVARRVTKSGATAAVRKGVKALPGLATAGPIKNITIKTKRGNKTLVKGVRSVSGGNKYLKWNLKVSWVKTTSDRKHQNTGISGHLPQGWTSDTLANRIDNPAPGDNWKPGDARAALKEIALSQNQGAYTSAGAVLDVELYTMD